MASTKEYLINTLDLLSGLDDISYRAMMGEYILYFKDKVFGGVYDDRFLIKKTKVVLDMMPDAELDLSYEGGSEMVLVDTDDRDFIREVVLAMYDEIPAPKKRKK
jgi:TfoX/Sxy family transcriptional regulator of competence genes